ncbi:MAG: pyridoxamine 5'-phosphate oxidase family protein [Candidatus Eremiobacteraeota bacterium]|nr:pyridoxamine 5'-phosphate oxidase family protein [Candidatus Eremiobacteraeota bacterium]
MEDGDKAENVGKLGDLIAGIKVAMLTTVDASGTMRSRPMGTLDADFTGDLWFFTSKNSGKSDELQSDSRVNVSYAAPDKNRYVSVTGTARVVHDRHMVEELWSPAHKAWFPKGLDDPDLGLIKVEVESAEYWDSPSGTVTQIIGLVKALATGQRAEVGEHERVELNKD